MEKAKAPHPQHDQHLCYLQNTGFTQNHLDEYKKLIKNAQFVCQNCGRSAVKEENLCKPERI